MGLFTRKPQVIENGFRTWLEGNDEYAWVTRYINARNEIDDEKAFADMQDERFAIFSYDMPMFRALVADLFAAFLGVEKNEIGTDDIMLLEAIERMPINITIRRIKAKASGNNWSVQYFKGTVYYGKTLQEALNKMIGRNEKIAKKFEKPTDKGVEAK